MLMRKRKKMPVSNYPTKGMKTEAKRGLEWREEFGRGGTRVGAVRARQIVAGENLSDDTVKRMFSFFSRQEGVKKAEGFKQGEKGYPSNGRIAWALWGGDAGFSWSRKLVQKMKKEKNMDEEQEVRHIEAVTEDDETYTVKFKKAILERYEEDEDEKEDEEKSSIIDEQKDAEFEITFEPDEEMDLRLNEEEIETTEEQIEMRDAVFPLEFKRDETDNRTINLSVSSESPVMRSYGLEILSHRSGDINLKRLDNKAPLLLNHDAEKQIGVIENTYLDESRGRLNASVRFGRSALAQEVYDDIIDGIRSQVSIGYSVDRLTRVDSDEYEEEEVYRASFTPHEVSIVSMAADQTVGIGRSLSFKTLSNTEVKMTQEDNKETVNVDEQIRVATTDAIKKRDKEISEIYALASRHNQTPLAQKAVADGQTIDQFRSELLSQIENTPVETKEIGMTEREVGSFSLVRAAKAVAGLIDKDEAAFEMEASREYAKAIGKETTGFFVPEDVSNAWGKRTMNTTNSAAVVFDDKQYGNLIDALTPFSTILNAGITTLAGNTGNITIPRVSALSTAGFVSTEGGDVSASDPTLDTVQMSEKILGAHTDITRLLLNNGGSLSVEQMVRDNLLRAVGVATDNAALNGTGSSGEPTGIVNVSGVNTTSFSSAGAPTYAEIIAMQSAIFADNKALDSNAVKYITTPALLGALKATNTTGAGSPAAAIDGRIDGRDVLISSQVPSNNVILGDFSEFIMATWSGIEVKVDDITLSKSGGLRLIILASMDFAVKHPVSFCVSS